MSADPSGRPDRRSPALILLALVLFLSSSGMLSCSDDEAGAPVGFGPGNVSGSPPTLPIPPLWNAPQFGYGSGTGRDAQVRIGAALNRAMLISRAEESAIGALNRDWPNPEGVCWTRTETAGEMVSTYLACRGGSRMIWRTIRDGSPGIEMPPYDHWIRMAGESAFDGMTGLMQTYLTNSEEIVQTWTWALGPDRKSGTWSFYEGAPSPSSLTASLERAVGENGADECTWTETGAVRWRLFRHAAADSGAMRFQEWSPSGGWVPDQEIVWRGQHGQWAELDALGNVRSTRSW